MGADFAWASPKGLVGVQRKTFPADLVASLHDGRFAKELIQMQELAFRCLVLEGKPLFTASGDLLALYGNFTFDQLTAFQFSVQTNHGVNVFWTANVDQTALLIRSLYRYTKQGKDSTLTGRSVKRLWKPGTPEFDVYLLETVPTVGHVTAKSVVDTLGGLPISWYGERKDLLTVPGVGKKTADIIMTAFHAPPSA